MNQTISAAAGPIARDQRHRRPSTGKSASAATASGRNAIADSLHESAARYSAPEIQWNLDRYAIRNAAPKMHERDSKRFHTALTTSTCTGRTAQRIAATPASHC